MTTFSVGRIFDFLLRLLEVFNPIVEPYRRFHENLPRKMQQTLTAFMFILPFGILVRHLHDTAHLPDFLYLLAQVGDHGHQHPLYRAEKF